MLSQAQHEALAARLRRGRGGAARTNRRPPGLTELPASAGQEQLWFLDRLDPGRPTYNLLTAVQATGPLEAGALSRAVDALVARHEALRTRLVAGPGSRPVQVIDPPPRGITRQADYRAAGRDGAWSRLRELAAAELARPFDLAAGPLLRAWLVALAADEHVLLVTVHHCVFDAWSAGVLVRDLAALYQAEAAGEPAGLDELPMQFADYALWERDRLTGPALAGLEDYWRGVLGGLESLRLPTDRPRPPVSGADGGERTRVLPGGLLRDLIELSRREDTTLFVTLMAGWQALLQRYTGRADVVVGTTSASRGRAVLAPLIGFLVNTLPIRCDLSGDPAFAEVLRRVREATVGAFQHQDLPFGKMVEALGVERDASRPPVVQLMFNLLDPPGAPAEAAGVAFRLAGKLADAEVAKFDISLFALAGEDELTLAAIYSTALFDAGTIDRMLAHFEVLLRGAAADPGARLSRLPVLTDAERRRELEEWNDTAAPFPAGCLHQRFEAQAAATPDAVAAQLGTTLVSYAQLNRQANQVARRLRAVGVGPEVLAGVCLPAGPRRLAAVLGILKAGGGYVPLDPALPAQRLSFMVADAGLAVVLADDATRAGLPETAVLSLDAAWPGISELDDTNLADTGVSPENVAYVIYTSGSTGQPKGVVVEHRQAVNFVQGMIACWGIGTSDAVLQYASLSFDVSVMDMFVPLLAGGRVVLVPPEAVHSPPRLAALIRSAGVTFACLTPSVLRLLAAEQFPGLRALVSGGEELPAGLARAFLRPGLRFYNTYGPTEAAVVTTYTLLDTGQAPPPIGRPLPNYRAYVLDADLNPVPVGVTGELHIGGAGVARGYLGRAELTRTRFIPDPFAPGQRLYKSGDLVRRRADGAIVFLGRADSQVKLRGLRIELGEIEAALAGCPGVTQAVVTITADQELAGYLRADHGTDLAALRDRLAATLPGYMIPDHLIPVDSFPLNASGKVDRAALPAPGRAAATPTAPASRTEAVLARLYAAVLGREHVGATDSFFALGGSSLQVMQLIDEIHRETGADLGAAEIFLHPAPRQLATVVEAGGGPAGPLARLSRGPGELPLIMIHAVGGTIVPYAHLASELAGTFEVSGLEAPGLTEPGELPASLADLVTDYTGRIRAAQPGGVYRLAGWSMGGVLAFEVARLLEQAGAEVGLLVLLDAPFAQPGLLPGERELAGQFLADAAASLGWDLAGLPDAAATPAGEQVDWLAGRLGGASQLRRRFEVFQAHVRMLTGYEPAGPPVMAPALIMSAGDSPNAAAAADWPRVLGGQVGALRLPGDHYAFLRPPLVTELGTAVLKWHDSDE
jgi:amino acid adenylation domain-containing protein